MVFYQCKWPYCLLLPVLWIVMKIKAGSMIYQPQFLIPPKHIGIANGSVHISEQAIQPYDLRSKCFINLCNTGIKTDRAGKIMQRQVQACAGFQQILYLFIWL